MNHEALKSQEYEKNGERLKLLFESLLQCSLYQEVGRGYIFTVNERILINQERGALMSQQSYLLDYLTEQPVRLYEVQESIENKIQFIKSKL